MNFNANGSRVVNSVLVQQYHVSGMIVLAIHKKDGNVLETSDSVYSHARHIIKTQGILNCYLGQCCTLHKSSANTVYTFIVLSCLLLV